MQFLVSSSSQTGKSDLVNRTIQFLQDQCRRGASKTIMPRTVPTTRWCPLGLTPSQRKRNQWVRAQKLREEAAKKERDADFNAIGPVIPMKQEWRVKEKTSAPALTASDDDMDLLDDDESLLVKKWVSTTDRHGHQHGVHYAGRVQRCQGGDRPDMSRPQRGHVRETRGVEPTLSHCMFKVTSTEGRSPACSSMAVLPST
jgi:hypothetical protein